MGRITLDMNKIGQSNLVPEGKYIVQIIDGTKAMTSKNDNQMLMLRLQITEGEYDELKLMPFFVMATSDARFLFDEVIVASGIDYDEDGVDIDNLIGANLIVELGVEEFEGKTRNKLLHCYAIGQES